MTLTRFYHLMNGPPYFYKLHNSLVTASSDFLSDIQYQGVTWFLGRYVLVNKVYILEHFWFTAKTADSTESPHTYLLSPIVNMLH